MISSPPKTKAVEIYGRPWNRREYIIVLHHYFLHRGESHDKGSPHVRNVASTLGRTPAAIAMRLHNFASLDPDLNQERSGLQNIGPLGRDVFYFWISKIEPLKVVAAEFESEAAAANVPDLFNPDPFRMPLAFGKYDVGDAIGDGGFGKVVSCNHVDTGKCYAIKIIRPDLVEDEEALARFRREIHVLKSIQHPHVIGIHDDNLDSERNFPGYVMDFAEWSLRLYIDRTRTEGIPTTRPLLPAGEAKEIILQILTGIEALHLNQPPVAHRDIKPENILQLANGNWVIADFGLAKFLPPVAMSHSFATASKKALGSCGYAAPEQAKDFRSADHRADIYSLGILIWEMFSPAWGTIDRSDTELPELLHRVVIQATDKRPENRYSSVSDLRRDFLAAVNGAYSI